MNEKYVIKDIIINYQAENDLENDKNMFSIKLDKNTDINTLLMLLKGLNADKEYIISHKNKPLN